MRNALFRIILSALALCLMAPSINQLPKSSGTGYSVTFTETDVAGFHTVGAAFGIATAGFELGSGFVGNLYACESVAANFSADDCDLITVLSADVSPPIVITSTRLWYVVEITTADSAGNSSRLVIRGTDGQVSDVKNLLDLDDVDETTFVGKAREVLAVNSGETALEFVPRLGANETEIYTAADLPTPSGGLITLPTGTYVLKNSITLSDSIQLAAGAVVEIIALGSGPTFTYTGIGAFIQDNLSGLLLIMNVINITLTGNGASLLDTNGMGVLIDRVTFTASGTGSSMGTSEDQFIAFSLRSSQINGFVNGLTIVNSPLLILSDVGFASPAAGGTVLFDIDALSTFVQVDNITVDLNVAEDIFNLDASFVGTAQISRVNNVNGTGFFEAGSLDETSPFVTVASSGMQKDSKNIGSVGAVGNTTATDMSGGPSLWVNLNLNTSAAAGADIELWTLDSTTTAQLSYDGIPPFHGTLIAAISGTSTGGAQTFEFRAVLNGSVITGAVPATRDFNATKGSVTLIVPIVAENGDTVRIQVQNIDGVSNIVVSELSVTMSWLLLIFIPIRREYAEAA